jgi:hypothetical protein
MYEPWRKSLALRIIMNCFIIMNTGIAETQID